MKILYVVQRYGERIVGGSEAACRMFAEQLANRGHEIDVLTSCAHDYVDWANQYEPGTSFINGVRVHRLPVVEPRSDEKFGPLHHWIVKHPFSAPLFEQQRWSTLMGPQLLDMRKWLLDKAHNYDVVVFMTYLYTTAVQGLPTISGRVPTILQPTAHDEPPAYISLYQSIFRQPDSYLFFTPEERRTVERLYQVSTDGSVIGIGVNLDDARGSGDRIRFKFGIGGHPYLVYVGRLDGSKGVGELIRFFLSYKDRNKCDLKLVLAGDGQLEIPSEEDIIVTGFLDEQEKRDLIAGSLALVQSSYFESFSIVLCEAWLESRPALVQGACDVLKGQAIRSGGAIPYEGFAEFEASIDLLLENPDLADRMGQSGRIYVEEQYNWDVVLDGFERTIEVAKSRFAQRRIHTTPSQ